MLKLSGIEKVYKVQSGDVWALKGIDLTFRKNEFVSILGASGCGKTTLLNIIGGLDKYTKGDLKINGISTRKFVSRDWDSYRNHSIGFIFQSYNLIPHQSVLGNVELALTISGVSKEERTRRAKDALDKVGLEGLYYKRPNQLSGGQCQRVAIARALVNEPDILLADEPTGALDTVTSRQIMNLIKEIAQDRLVIMVTHNPELANEYSTRIIRLKDGLVTDDSNPYNEEGSSKRMIENSNRKTKMSFFTAFRLSLQNLFSKRARTFLTAFAGAIGIIGVSAVLSVSNGIQTFVDDMQKDMLSGNPITVEETAFDLMSLMTVQSEVAKAEIVKDAGFVNVHSMINSLVKRSQSMENMMVSNEIDETYLKYINQMPEEYKAMVLMNYGINVSNNIYADFSETKGGTSVKTSLSAIQATYTAILNKTDYAKYSSIISGVGAPFAQAPANEEYVMSQYNLLNGKFATKKDEIMIVLNQDHEISDLLLAQLGYFSQEEFTNLLYKAGNNPLYKESLQKEKFSYEEILGREFTWYKNDVVFNKNTNPIDPALSTFGYNPTVNSSFTDGLNLKVVGILEPQEDLSYGCLSSGFYYTEELTDHVINENLNSEITTHLKEKGDQQFSSFKMGEGASATFGGIYYDFKLNFEGTKYDEIAIVGTMSDLSRLDGMFGDTSPSGMPDYYFLTSRELGGEELANSIWLYSRNFEEKNLVLAYLDAWNNDGDIIVDGATLTKEMRQEIKYQDTLSLIMMMIKSFINLITIALIAFTSLSLVVSCVMIAIITYVSVVERIKEIGVIRSLGGRKSDVSSLFIAETFIIGLLSGVFGVGVTYLLSAIINIIVNSLAGIKSIAILPVSYALIMISISVLLNLISGFIPARMAAKKDPVVALRTE